MKRKLIIPALIGDSNGVGPEVVNSLVVVLKKLFEGTAYQLEMPEYKVGHQVGGIPQVVIDACIQYGCAVKPPIATRENRSFNADFREKMGLVASVRHAVYTEGLPVSDAFVGLDVIAIRDLQGGMYRGIEVPISPRNLKHFLQKIALRVLFGLSFEHAVIMKPYTVSEIEKLTQLTSDLLGHWNVSPELFCFSEKANISKEVGVMFKEICKKNFSDLSTYRHIDDLTGRLILFFENFRAVLTTNMFGDVMTDALAYMMGGPGFMPGVEMSRTFVAAAPLHGTAEAIAGKGMVNPIAMIWSGAKMLSAMEWIRGDGGLGMYSNILEKSVRLAISDLAANGHFVVGQLEVDTKLVQSTILDQLSVVKEEMLVS